VPTLSGRVSQDPRAGYTDKGPPITVLPPTSVSREMRTRQIVETRITMVGTDSVPVVRFHGGAIGALIKSVAGRADLAPM
jgi:hypothetical protein